jgi:hypothetical protein
MGASVAVDTHVAVIVPTIRPRHPFASRYSAGCCASTKRFFLSASKEFSFLFPDVLGGLTRITLDEVFEQHQDVVFTLSKRWNFDWEYVQPVK